MLLIIFGLADATLLGTTVDETDVTMLGIIDVTVVDVTDVATMDITDFTVGDTAVAK